VTVNLEELSRSPLDGLASVDFTTIAVWTESGLVTCYLLFVMELATQRVLFAGCTQIPDESWMYQAARNLSHAEDEFLRGKKYLLMDRNAKFSEAFRVTLEQVRTEAVRLPPQSPDLNPNLERFNANLALMRSCHGRALSRRD
jgi:putative transposase